jgi:hypothetical protein
LAGVLAAQAIALQATAQDLFVAHNLSVANDALEAAANLVSKLDPATKLADVPSIIRQLKG